MQETENKDALVVLCQGPDADMLKETIRDNTTKRPLQHTFCLSLQSLGGENIEFHVGRKVAVKVYDLD